MNFESSAKLPEDWKPLKIDHDEMVNVFKSDNSSEALIASLPFNVNSLKSNDSKDRDLPHERQQEVFA